MSLPIPDVIKDNVKLALEATFSMVVEDLAEERWENIKDKVGDIALLQSLKSTLNDAEFKKILHEAYEEFASNLHKDELPEFFDKGFFKIETVRLNFVSYVATGKADLDQLAEEYGKRLLPPTDGQKLVPILQNYLLALRQKLFQHEKFSGIMLANTFEQLQQELSKSKERDDVTHQKLDELQKGMDALQQDFAGQTTQSPTIAHSSHARLVNHVDNVRQPAKQFIGRTTQIDQILPLLNNKQQVNLHGYAGEGKTALAREIETRWLTDHPDTTILEMDAGQATADDLFDALAQLVNLSDKMLVADTTLAKVNLAEQILNALKPSLIVIDNVWDEAGLATFMQAVPTMPVLITSRPSYPAYKTVHLSQMTETEALDLLRVFKADDVETYPQLAQKLCKDVGYLAFALDIAGYLLQKRYGLTELTRRLADKQALIMSERDDVADERRKSVAALVQTSLDALESEDARQAFLDMGAFFTGTITPMMLALYRWEEPQIDDTALAQVRVANPQLPAEMSDEDLKAELSRMFFAQFRELVETLLQSLADVGLLLRIPEQNEVHQGQIYPVSVAYYRMHDLAYQYAHAQNTTQDSDRAIDTSLQFTHIFSQLNRDHFAHLRAELDNFIGAIETASSRKRHDQVIDFAANLNSGQGSDFLGVAGYYRRAIQVWEHALASARASTNQQAEGVALGQLGAAYDYLGDYPQAIDYYQQALAISRLVGDKKNEGNWLGNLGIAYASLGDFRQAIDYYQQALVIAQQIGDKQVEGNWLGNLGIAYHSLGDYPQAIDYYQQALAISRQIGDKRGEGNQLGNLGIAYDTLGDYNQAIDYHQQSLAIKKQIGDKLGEGNSLGNLGNVYDTLGDYPQAINYYQQSLAISRQIGNKRGEGITLGNLGNVYNSLGDHPQAIEYYQQALAISQQIGNKVGEGNSLGNLGIAYGNLGDYPQAIDYHQQSLAIKKQIGDKLGEGNSLGNLGIAYDTLGNHHQAIEYYQQALVISQQIGDKRGEGITLGNLGNVYDTLGDYPQAIDYHQQSLAIKKQIGDKRGEGNQLGNLGIAYLAMGDCDKAKQHYEQARALFDGMGLAHMVEWADARLAKWEAQCGKGATATDSTPPA